MAVEKLINFATLASGTELETPMGVGKFMAYKKGNFKKQNVQVAHPLGKLKWYTEDALKLVQSQKNDDIKAQRGAGVSAYMADLLYYEL